MSVVASGQEWVHGYSRVMVRDPFIFVTNTTGFDLATMTIPPAATDQIRNIWKTVSNVLLQADSSLSEIVRCKYFVTEQEDCEPVLRVCGWVLSNVRPAMTMIVVPALAHPLMRVSVDITAMWRGRMMPSPQSLAMV